MDVPYLSMSDSEKEQYDDFYEVQESVQVMNGTPLSRGFLAAVGLSPSTILTWQTELWRRRFVTLFTLMLIGMLLIFGIGA